MRRIVLATALALAVSSCVYSRMAAYRDECEAGNSNACQLYTAEQQKVMSVSQMMMGYGLQQQAISQPHALTMPSAPVICHDYAGYVVCN